MRRRDQLEGRIIYLLILTIIGQFIYPITVGRNPFFLLTYQIFYGAIFIGAVYLVSFTRWQLRILAILSIIWVTLGVVFAFTPQLQWINLVGFFVVLCFQMMMTGVLLKFIFRADRVNLDVLLAACTVYILLGALFIPIYALIENLTFFPEQTAHAFVDGSNEYPGELFPWQVLNYYSYATLTTLGYGDVLPVTPWARAVATIESIIGVLYTAVIVARLVGMYAAGEVEDELDEHYAELEKAQSNL